MRLVSVVLALWLAAGAAFAVARPADCAERLRKAAQRTAQARQALESFLKTMDSRVAKFTEGIFEARAKLASAPANQKAGLEARLRDLERDKKSCADEESRLAREQKSAEADEQRIKTDCR